MAEILSNPLEVYRKALPVREQARAALNAYFDGHITIPLEEYEQLSRAYDEADALVQWARERC